jgi:preprotein translocase subunit SecE
LEWCTSELNSAFGCLTQRHEKCYTYSKSPLRGFFVRLNLSLFMNRLLQYFKDTRGELRHVSWPTRTQALTYTALVVVISILTSLYLGFFDFLFTTLLDRYVL